MALHVRVASSLLSQPAQRAQNCMMRPSSGTSKFAALGVEKVCRLHGLQFFKSTNCSWASVQRRSQAQCCCQSPLRVLHNVRLGLVHGSPRGASALPARTEHNGLLLSEQVLVQPDCLHRFCSRQNLDCSFAWALSRATLADGTWSIVRTGARRTTSAATLSHDHRLASSPAALKMHHGVVGISDPRRKQINPRSQCGPQGRHHSCMQATADQYVA